MCERIERYIKHIENKRYIFTMNDIILSTQNGEPVHPAGTSPKRFGKRHDHVIRDIAEIVKSFPKNGDTPLFFKTEYVHPQNHQKYPMYLMNRDGFSLLAMGFTGKRPPSERPQQAAGQNSAGTNASRERLEHIRKKKGG